MATSRKVAIITGSNKGIGFAIVRELCKKFDGDVYLTARSESLGKSSVSELEKEGLHPKFHQLDVTDEESVIRLSQFIKTQYGGLDVLVNNAGIAHQSIPGVIDKPGSTVPLGVQAEETLKTNYWGVLTVCKHLLPLVRSHGRLVHLSSTLGVIALNNHNGGMKEIDRMNQDIINKWRNSPDIQQKLKSLQTIDEVNECMKTFVRLCHEGKHKEEGWADSAYGVSKAGLCLITPMQQKLIDQEKPNRSDIIINSCCPGYVATDLNGHSGSKTTLEAFYTVVQNICFSFPPLVLMILHMGADTPVYLALLPPNTAEPRGKFVRDRKVMEV